MQIDLDDGTFEYVRKKSKEFQMTMEEYLIQLIAKDLELHNSNILHHDRCPKHWEDHKPCFCKDIESGEYDPTLRKYYV